MCPFTANFLSKENKCSADTKTGSTLDWKSLCLAISNKRHLHNLENLTIVVAAEISKKDSLNSIQQSKC